MPPQGDPPGASRDHVRNNRAGWNDYSAEYEAEHASQLSRSPDAWGAFSIPESTLRVLDDVTGTSVLELGCGAARWSIALAGRGAEPTGIDLSERQLEVARRLVDESGAPVSLVQASAEELPFADASFDIVFCDHGAMTFADPYATVPEVARVLRPRGQFAFNIGSILREVCIDAAADLVTETLHVDYFGMHRLEYDDNEVNFQLPYGEWIRLFRANAFSVEDLVELRPPEDATTTYTTYATREWARRWPAENIWKLRKETILT
ncbi:MAG: class I SAM-dependent methyltransferase [Actinobacteria bacterium]|nr:class I SAM-dependent methyltransferase [Actinomycetota bacterium]